MPRNFFDIIHAVLDDLQDDGIPATDDVVEEKKQQMRREDSRREEAAKTERDSDE
jgi:hypothetical protein